MVSVSFQKNEKVYQTGGIQKVQTAPFPTQNIDSKNVTSPSFRAEAYTSAVTVRTTLATSDEKKKYKELTEVLDSTYKKKLEYFVLNCLTKSIIKTVFKKINRKV